MLGIIWEELPSRSTKTLLIYAYLVLTLVFVTRLLLTFYCSLTHPLRAVPGLFLVRFGRLYLLYHVSRGSWERHNIALHRQYGPIVRIASNMFSIHSADDIKAIYNISSKFAKSDWYNAWKHSDPNRGTLFAERDIKAHADQRRRFQAMYSMSSLVHYEGYVDECAEILCTRLSEFAAGNEVVDMAAWFRHYAFDVIGDITYSQRFGFLDAGKDVGGLQAALHKVVRYGSLVGICARWHPLLYKVTNWLGVGGGRGRDFLIKFIEQRIKQRKGTKQDDAVRNEVIDSETAPMDFMAKLMAANEENPSRVSIYHVWSMSLADIIAGSDTTAVSLSSILYHLLKSPETLQKLREEIELAEQEGRCGSDKITFKQSKDMPYLQAVIKEALRMCAATGTPLWRDVPKDGVELGDYHFPAGTTVGLNTWCAHYNEDVFGPDVAQFRPERWLEAEKEQSGRLKAMEAHWVPVSLFTASKTLISLLTLFAVWLRLENISRSSCLVLGDVETNSAACSQA